MTLLPRLCSKGFLSRHLLAAVTTIYIDVLHDADVGTPADVSDKKLVNMPYVVKVFLRMEQTGSTSSQQVWHFTFSYGLTWWTRSFDAKVRSS